mgnify:CR=1 FL=1
MHEVVAAPPYFAAQDRDIAEIVQAAFVAADIEHLRFNISEVADEGLDLFFHKNTVPRHLRRRIHICDI